MQDAQIGSGSRPGRQGYRSILWPVVLILLGLLFLAQNLGLISADIWLNLWRYWPVLLVLAGIELILGRSSWRVGIGIVVLVLVLGAFITAVSMFTQFGPWNAGSWGRNPPQPASIQRLVEDLGDARQATVDVRHGAGYLMIGALPTDSMQFVDADLAHGENQVIDQNVVRSGDQINLSVRSRNERNFTFGPNSVYDNWTINLSPKVPIDLTVRSGASDTNLDLSGLRVTHLDVQVGASSLKVTMPQTGRTEARVQAGAASVEIAIPNGVAARIRPRSGLSGTTIDELRFPKVGNYYQSPDFDTAVNRVDVDVQTGVSGLRVR